MEPIEWTDPIPKTVSSLQTRPKLPKIFITTEIKILKSWHSERGQLDKLEIESKRIEIERFVGTNILGAHVYLR
jgi:hypothetical protein